MGKKNIILTEGQMDRLTKRVIEEQRRFENQGMVDAILDKISEYGMDSLTDEEKNILNNPDEKFEPKKEFSDAAEEIILSNEAMSRLISSGLLDYKDIMILGDEEDGGTVFQIFQVNNIIDEDGLGFGYFKAGNKLRLTTSQEKDEILVEGMGNPGDSMMRVMEYIKQNWEPNIGLPVHVEGIDF
jgi:hypothetical protein